MLNNFIFYPSEMCGLKEDFMEILKLQDTREVQAAFFKILAKNNFLKKIIHPAKNVDYAKTLITIGNACITHGLLLSMGAHCFAAATTLEKYANTTLQHKVYNDIENGNCITAFAATESNAGSDIMNLQTYYTSQENTFELNGEKSYITNATSADYILVFATKNSKLYDRGLSLFLVPANTPGIIIKPLDTTHNLNHSGLGNIQFENVRLNKELLIGKEFQGASIFREALNIERSFILIPHIGTMLRWFNICVNHAKKRIQHKKFLYQFQNISDKIIDIHEKIKISQLLAKDLFTFPTIPESKSSIIKNYISEALNICHQHTLSILGASAIYGEKKLPENLIDTFSTLIYSGTREMQKNIILNSILKITNEDIK